ncbi:GMC oxidoreductase [Truncatella angustata]|uniref:GMC oxidoreductase n=1 Tax=Truncatella angustata TaxID=152316 RepID=A0A9P9A0K5_9PEZI|nr:GMC oxidoreductase [Truncatella angustata]KAH6658487.1 GMC oxidoreductase [Truncatella angustata]
MRSLIPLLASLAAANYNSTSHADYEYIVVGSGPGGGPLAANLARRGHKVLLIEAGDDQGTNPNETVPAFATRSSEDDTMSWGFFVEHYSDPEEAAKDPKMAWDTPNGTLYVGLDPPAGSAQKGIFYPRAGTLGGCGSHNALIAILPHDSDWNDIAKITKDKSWSAKNMQKYFERLERCRYLPEGTPGHGFHGWLEIELPDPVWETSNEAMMKPVLNFTGQKGFNHDINAPKAQNKNQLFDLPLIMNKKGRRNGPRSFVVATANARNRNGSKKYPLYVRTQSFVTKVLFDETRSSHRKPKAVGVEYVEGQGLYKADPRAATGNTSPSAAKSVYASREIIIAGGAFNTPQILKLSGIGPKEELQQFDIPVRVDLPGVGTNLQDNYEYSIVAQSKEVVSLFANSTVDGRDVYFSQWDNEGSGPYKGDGIEAAVLAKSSISKTGEVDMFLYGTPLLFTGFYPGYSTKGFGTFHEYTWVVLKFRQEDKSGTVTLRSSNPFDVPKISYEFYATPDKNPKNDGEHDLNVMVEGVRLSRQFHDGVAAPSGPLNEIIPGRQVQSDEQLKEEIKHNSFSHHASASCPIGSEDDPMACLDSRFRVRGVDSLRVVDASVFPQVPGTFPQLPVYMISEKACDVLLEDAGFKPRTVNFDDATLESLSEDEILIDDFA